MARSFLLLSILKEAYELDLSASRRQAQSIRNMTVESRSDEFVRIYRLSEDLIQNLEFEIKGLLPKSKRKGRALTNRCKILCALSFLATGSYQKILGRSITTYLSQTSVSRCIKEIVEALNHPSIVKKYIRFPQNASERQLLKERFYEKFHIPGVIGCIDGTFVAIIRPHDNEERYYCRKGFHARNVMLIVDADLNILHVDVSYGGATHDSFVFNNSIIKEHLENLTNSGETVYLLGDSGYPQRKYLMTPVNGAADNTPEGYYNKLHATARNTVERTIGVLKGRFRCLLVQRVLHYHPDTAGKIIIACCVLHNICNRAGLPSPLLEEEEMAMERSIAQDRQRHSNLDTDLVTGRNARISLINSLWRGRIL